MCTNFNTFLPVFEDQMPKKKKKNLMKSKITKQYVDGKMTKILINLKLKNDFGKTK